MSVVLVTGANGFIGNSLCERLKSFHQVITLDRSKGDITSYDTFRNLDKVDYVFHLAARTFVPDSWNETTDFLKSNIIGTANVLDYCKSKNIPMTFVSAYIYGKPESLPIKEDSIVKPNNPYALSKYMAEQLCSFYSTFHNLNITVIRPFNIYGPGQPKHFLIPKIVNMVRKKVQIELFDLSPKRDYIYIDDVVDALVKTLELKLPGYNVFNIGSGKSLSVKEVVESVQNIAGTNLEVISTDMQRKEELDDVYADISNSVEKLHWAPKTEFHIGIKQTIDA
jgi:GDP-4-dehydro-6-deoxy-D-mannose reductase